MRQSRKEQASSSETGFSFNRSKSRQTPLLALLLTGSLSTGFSSFAWSQSPTPAVYSVLEDTAMNSREGVEIATFTKDRSYNALASSNGSVSARSMDPNIVLGPSDEGTIVSISPGEDRIIGDASSENYVSTDSSPFFGSGAGYSSVPSSHMGGGSYSGYGSTSYSNSNPCCPENCHSFYLGYEPIFIQRRTDRSFTLSQSRFFDEFDYEFGSRYTFGQMLDCTDAVEFVYTGQLNWERRRDVVSATSSLDSILTTSNGYVASQIDTFNGARFHSQRASAELQSFELNRRWFAWDIMSTLIGARAIEYNENFSFDTVDFDNALGFLRTNHRNLLLGVHFGGDVYKPIGQRLSIGSRTRLGLFANFNKGETLLVNRNAILLNSQDSSVDFGGILQYGAVARYRIFPRVSVMAGYDFWILAGVETVSDQRYVPITPTTGNDYRAQDIVFFQGGTGGLEITF